MNSWEPVGKSSRTTLPAGITNRNQLKSASRPAIATPVSKPSVASSFQPPSQRELLPAIQKSGRLIFLRLRLLLFQLRQLRNMGPDLLEPASDLVFRQYAGAGRQRDMLVGLFKFNGCVIEDLKVNEGFFPPSNST